MLASVVVIGATLAMTIRHAKHRKADEELHLAFIACQNNLEELRSVPIDQLPSMHGKGFDVPGRNGVAGGLRAVDGDEDGLPGQFSVTVDQTTGGSTMYLVKATVTWTGNLKRQSLVLESLMEGR